MSESYSPNNSKLSEPSLTLRKSALGSGYDDEIFSKVSSFFFGNSKFQEKINKFAEKHAFDYDPHVQEFNLTMSALHETFITLIEEQIDSFLASHGWYQEQFVLASRRAFLNHENGPNSIFIKCFLNAHEFDVFIEMLSMKRKEMQEAEHEKQRRRFDSNASNEGSLIGGNSPVKRGEYPTRKHKHKKKSSPARKHRNMHTTV